MYLFQPRTGRTPMIIDTAHNAVSSTQVCLALTLRPGGETIARYLKVMKWKTHFFDENRLYMVLMSAKSSLDTTGMVFSSIK